ncbi:MAG TPA: RtcB family protein [Bacteroidales bacterium]|nr:RtcB family protein [Bacteroidales bacterium]HNR41082.1 RtcB family protein [Bacteroidales bacterium]HPM18205.1 RtcB family protein [Bacteroidales bacterium]HQG77148.1 RtcB family protein [Bacteroidales bacterium]
MGRLRLSGQELKRIGYKSDRTISLAINLARKNFKKAGREEILITLEKINLQPHKYLKDPVWGKLAQLLTEKPEEGRKVPDLKKSRRYFKIFGEELIDPEAIRQMELAMSLPISVKGALMPDAHVGYGLPIGGVLAAYNAVIPYGVGMDIGCRMCLSVFPFSPRKINDDREQIKRILMNETRFGLAEFRDEQDHEILGRKEFDEIKFLRTLHKKFAAQLGTSGHGNHFVDVGHVIIPEYSELIKLQAGEYFAVLSHSGSRNFGAEVCRHYTGIARGKLGLRGAEAQLAWLELGSEEGEEYWAAMNLAGDYSHANHRIIHRRLARAFGEAPLVIIENHHNFAWKETLATGEEVVIHRKGATPAGIGDIGVIPGTMASPAFIVGGKGNEESLNSASHGAGRKMSRNVAVKDLSGKQMKEYLDSRRIELLGAGTDESPFAYKDIHEVMDYQKDLVEILGTFHPAIVRMA